MLKILCHCFFIRPSYEDTCTMCPRPPCAVRTSLHDVQDRVNLQIRFQEGHRHTQEIGGKYDGIYNNLNNLERSTNLS